MNARTRTVLAAALVLAVAGPAAPAFADAPALASLTTGHRAPDSDALDAAIAALPNADATAALARVGGTEGSWRGSTGVHDLPSGRKADPHARFRAGSVTKVFTSAVVLQLAAERKVGLDRPVRTYLPELIPAAYEKVTVRQLLNHTSGLPTPDFPGKTVEDWYANRFQVFTPREMVASATAKRELFPAGTKQNYSNIGYTVAGLLIEKVTGHSYENEVARRIIGPLGLRGTSFPGTDPRIHGPHNRGYQKMKLSDGTTGLRDVSVWSPTDGWAAGDIISTTADLERFTHALFRGRVVRGPLLEEMFTLPPARVTDLKGEPAIYSVGLTSWQLGGRRVWGKTGGRWGYNAGIGGTRDLSRTLVYSVNSTDAKGADRNKVVLGLVFAAFGTPDPA
ncbi:beta-lactamase family protein [Streptomyces sp. NBC_01142]|uniref:serine hydrolase domain-containing protein n=1 Tax=Streptomyces sp. NBC_01142 TaxID=2975865 RepID=UPI0022520953|nr:serine hydrolase domain-containing protein [Streptomyces sp. NBC_01142]MCX4819706.1 beta-lactamase family protein [Streptomyces sp. NBC_01142]